MAVKLYLIYTIAVFAYSIYRNINLFKTGKYDPNPFAKSKDGIYEKYSFVITLPIAIGPLFLLKERSELFALLLVFVIYSVILVCCTSVLNYLMYKKSREKKILKDTLLFNAVIAIVTTLIWKYITKI